MTIRCKFRCQSVRKFSAAGWHTEPKVDFMYEYEFSAITADANAENKVFFASTPNGTLKFSAVATDRFEPGKDYYLDISPATS